MQPTWMCNQLQNTKKIEMCHDVYLIYGEEHIYDKEYYIVIQPFFQFCGCKKTRNTQSCDQSFSSKTSLSKKKTCHYDQIELDT